MARDDPQMKIRLPEALKVRIEAVAEESGRTLNAEVVHRLEQSFAQANDTFHRELNAQVAAIEARSAAISARGAALQARIENLSLKNQLYKLQVDTAPLTLAGAQAVQKISDAWKPSEIEENLLRDELADLMAERRAHIEHSAKLRQIVAAGRAEIEERIRAGLADRAAKGEPSPPGF